jgi:hypothetical protein
VNADPPGDGPFYCPECRPQQVEITDRVRAERDGQMMILREVPRSGGKWSVIVKCPNGHEVAIEGEFP